MPLPFKLNKPDLTDAPIKKVLEELEQHDPNSPEFATNLTNLERLTELKTTMRRKLRVSPDTMALIAGNLLGIGLIVLVEQYQPMTSKAMNYVKPQTPKT